MTTSGHAASVLEPDPALALARDVARGLALDPKRIPSRYLYDGLGSHLFEAICELPWYTITRGERSLLANHADAIVGDLGRRPTVIELGAGNGSKLSLLLDSVRRPLDGVTVHLVDISAAALGRSTDALARHDVVRVVTHEAPYEVGLGRAVQDQGAGGPALVAFLGSNIGNLSRDESDRFLRLIRDGCRPGDRLLLGADLVKPEADLLLAYDDPLGLTAAFTRNLLVRLNRELDGDFDLAAFDYRAVWNAEAARVEAYLVSRDDQLVCLRGAGCCTSFARGETIWTESSHKYRAEEIVAMGDRASFRTVEQWVEPDTQFALTLFEATS